MAETAIIGVPDDLTGEAINAVVSLKAPDISINIEAELVLHIRRTIAPFAAPKRIFIVKDLPKTRSGKIVRRILRKILIGERNFGDISTVIVFLNTLYHAHDTDLKLVGRSWCGGRDHQGVSKKLIQQSMRYFAKFSFLCCK